MRSLRSSLLVLPVAALAACGGEVTDVTGGVDELNGVLQPQGVQLDCPDEVDGGEGTEFDCTLKSTKNPQKTAKVTLKIVEEDGELAINVADRGELDRALRQVAA